MARAIDNYAQDLERARERLETLEARLAERDRSADLVAAAELRAQEAERRAQEAERALGAVIADQGDGLREVRVTEGGHRDQQLIGQIAGLGHGVAAPSAASG